MGLPKQKKGLPLIKRTNFFLKKFKVENGNEDEHKGKMKTPKKIDNGQVDRQVFRMHGTIWNINVQNVRLSSPFALTICTVA